jgi:hypothetical protein
MFLQKKFTNQACSTSKLEGVEHPQTINTIMRQLGKEWLISLRVYQCQWHCESNHMHLDKLTFYKTINRKKSPQYSV